MLGQRRPQSVAINDGSSAEHAGLAQSRGDRPVRQAAPEEKAKGGQGRVSVTA